MSLRPYGCSCFQPRRSYLDGHSRWNESDKCSHERRRSLSAHWPMVVRCFTAGANFSWEFTLGSCFEFSKRTLLWRDLDRNCHISLFFDFVWSVLGPFGKSVVSFILFINYLVFILSLLSKGMLAELKLIAHLSTTAQLLIHSSNLNLLHLMPQYTSSEIEEQTGLMSCNVKSGQNKVHLTLFLGACQNRLSRNVCSSW